jgi:hypothetical protein
MSAVITSLAAMAYLEIPLTTDTLLNQTPTYAQPRTT